MDRILVVLCVAVVFVHGKPVAEVADAISQPKSDSGNDNIYKKITGKIDSLKSQIATLKDTLRKQKDTKAAENPKKEVKEVNSLLADLEKAVADDRKQDSSPNTRVSDVTKPKNVAEKDNEEFASIDSDFDAFDEIVNEDVTPSENKAEIVVPTLDEVAKDSRKETVEKNIIKNEKKDQMTDVKDIVLGITSDFHRIRSNFAEMKKDYSVIVKDHPLDETSKNKFESIRSVMNNVADEFKDLKAQLTISKSNEMQDESTSEHTNGETRSLLADMKGELKEVSDTIQELNTIKGVVTSEPVENEKKDQIRDMKDAVLDIRSDLNRIKKAFTEVKKDYSAMVRNRPLDEASKNKFESIRNVVNKVMDEFKDLKAGLAVPKSNEMQDESTSEYTNGGTRSLLADMKGQLKELSDTIHELKKTVVVAIDKKEDVEKEKEGMEEKEEDDEDKEIEMDIIKGVVKSEMEKEEDNEMRDVKDAVIDIRSDFHRIRKAFTEVKKDYSTIVRDHLLDETSKNKFESIRSVMNDVVDEVKDLKGRLTVPKSDEMQDESTSEYTNDETFSLLTGMKDQLEDASNTIQELHDSLVAKREEKGGKEDIGEEKEDEDEGIDMVIEKEKAKRQTMEIKMDVTEEKKEKDKDDGMNMAMEIEKRNLEMKEMEIKLDTDKENKNKKREAKDDHDTKDMLSESNKGLKDEKDMTKLNVMKDEVKNVIYAMKKIKEDIEKRKSTPVQTKDDGAKQENHGKDRLATIKEKLDMIKKEVENLEKSRENI